MLHTKLLWDLLNIFFPKNFLKWYSQKFPWKVCNYLCNFHKFLLKIFFIFSTVSPKLLGKCREKLEKFATSFVQFWNNFVEIQEKYWEYFGKISGIFWRNFGGTWLILARTQYWSTSGRKRPWRLLRRSVARLCPSDSLLTGCPVGDKVQVLV